MNPLSGGTTNASVNDGFGMHEARSHRKSRGSEDEASGAIAMERSEVSLRN